MKSNEIREKFIEFFKQKGHSIIPSAPLVPENDPTVLFTTAGMHPLVPYLLGEKHPLGKRLANFQKCFRTVEIDEDKSIGDYTHHTFFEMLGNWSLGDYFKKEAIEWSMEFMTGKEWLNLDPVKIYVSVFEGDKDAPFDEEAADTWKNEFLKHGIQALIYGKDKKTTPGEYRIFPLGKADNWWGPAGDEGPCGPDTEMFYYVGSGKPDLVKERLGFNDDNFVEIWNDVFMQYNKKLVKNEKGEVEAVFEAMKNKNVDTGMGLERMVSVTEGLFDNYKTDLFAPVIKVIEEAISIKYESDMEVDKSIRIIADHIRASVFIIADGIVPSNVDQGYVLRRLLRRAVRHIRSINKIKKTNYTYQTGTLEKIAPAVIEKYKETYPEILKNKGSILREISKEEKKFESTLERGMKEFEKVVQLEEADNQKINGKVAFNLYQTYGFPIEITEELAEERDMEVDREGFEIERQKHSALSRQGASKKFKGGLSDRDPRTVKLHTAAHLMNAGLMKVLGNHISQKGSNINPQRLRFDFSHSRKLTDEEISEVESYVNKAIKAKAEVRSREMTVEEAKNQGAIGVFENKYSAKVKVYSIDDYSKEICGGPHVKNTGELGKFKITKQESSGAGVRRIKAILE